MGRGYKGICFMFNPIMLYIMAFLRYLDFGWTDPRLCQYRLNAFRALSLKPLLLPLHLLTQRG
jgi:hypothetical protein